MSVLTRMYRGETEFDFVAASRKTLLVSGVLIVASFLLILIRPFNLSIDFTGGVIVTVENTTGATVEDIRADLRDVGYATARVQITGDGFINVQTEALEPDDQDALASAVARAAGTDTSEVNVSAVGPTFGAEVTRRAVEALVIFLVVVAAFIAWRFEWKMALAALAALFHDLVVSAGFYALAGFAVTPSTIIAVLTIMGYSLYDTVVVFDKVTENVHDAPNKVTYSGIVNLSMNEVLMRSVNTSLTSLLPVGSLLVVGFLAIGAETLQEFALALFIGMAVGTYSSIFVAAPLLARWKETEPEWERRRRRATRTDGHDHEDDVVPDPTPQTIAEASTAAARAPKQRRKRR
ncbi:MAG TPA: protein translocase subunit SecF [Acidimicrobiia bacterium]|nr:protein translocase subunit SecF [Acidimicrobiia bacterium]